MRRLLSLILATTVMSLGASYLLWRDRLELGQAAVAPAPTTTTPQANLGNRISPALRARLDRPLPADFSCAGGLQKTIHRLGDSADRAQIFLIKTSFESAGMRIDAPVRSNVGGMKASDALLKICAEYDPPLTCDAAGDIIHVDGPQFSYAAGGVPVVATRGRVLRPTLGAGSYDVHLLAADPTQEKALIDEVLAHTTDLMPPPAKNSYYARPFITAGTLYVARPPLFQYAVAKYLNRRHARLARIDFAVRTGAFTGTAVALVMLWMLIRKLAEIRRRRRGNLCRHCGYDLRASVDRCPECGTPFATPRPLPAAMV